jgi:hypothetical protein
MVLRRCFVGDSRAMRCRQALTGIRRVCPNKSRKADTLRDLARLYVLPGTRNQYNRSNGNEKGAEVQNLPCAPALISSAHPAEGLSDSVAKLVGRHRVSVRESSRLRAASQEGIVNQPMMRIPRTNSDLQRTRQPFPLDRAQQRLLRGPTIDVVLRILSRRTFASASSYLDRAAARKGSGTHLGIHRLRWSRFRGHIEHGLASDGAGVFSSRVIAFVESLMAREALAY